MAPQRVLCVLAAACTLGVSCSRDTAQPRDTRLSIILEWDDAGLSIAQPGAVDSAFVMVFRGTDLVARQGLTLYSSGTVGRCELTVVVGELRVRVEGFTGGRLSSAGESAVMVTEGSHQTVRIPMSVISPGPGPSPSIEVTPTILEFPADAPGVTTAAITIANTGNAALVVSLADDAPWLTMTPQSFTVAPGADQQVNVAATTAGLAPASPAATIVVASNDPAQPTVVVWVRLTATQPTVPDIDVTPTSLSMTAQTGSSTTATLTVRNTGNATLTVTSITDNQTWLSASPTDFSVNAGSSRAVTVTANASGLSAGTYSGTITIASNDPDENPKTVPVTFTVTSAATPDIDVTPTSLSMSAQTGSSATATMTVRNTGNATLSVTSITDNQTWLSETPTNFSVSAGSSRDVTVTANASGLSAGTHNATITIASNDPDENPKTVPVTFTVTGGGTAQIDMLRIPGGTFQMGSNSQWAYSNEQPVHQVTVSSFYMSKYEVTQAQYQAVMGTDPSYFSGDNRPVEQVSWYDAARFCNALSQTAGLTPCYNESDWSCDFSANGYRLPTEAEWEYACRAGTSTDLYSGDLTSGYQDPNMDAIGWYWYNSDRQTHDVGGRQPNTFGLYDMSGNVWEWCNDWVGSYSSGAQIDPTGPSIGSSRVLRGGSWDFDARGCRSAYRGFGSLGLGFRLVRR